MKTKIIEIAAKNPSSEKRMLLEIEVAIDKAKIIVHDQIHGKTSVIQSVFEVDVDTINFLAQQVHSFFQNEYSND